MIRFISYKKFEDRVHAMAEDAREVERDIRLAIAWIDERDSAGALKDLRVILDRAMQGAT